MSELSPLHILMPVSAKVRERSLAPLCEGFYLGAGRAAARQEAGR